MNAVDRETLEDGPYWVRCRNVAGDFVATWSRQYGWWFPGNEEEQPFDSVEIISERIRAPICPTRGRGGEPIEPAHPETNPLHKGLTPRNS